MYDMARVQATQARGGAGDGGAGDRNSFEAEVASVFCHLHASWEIFEKACDLTSDKVVHILACKKISQQ